MAMLPEGGALGPALKRGTYPTRTWRADRASGRLTGFTDGLEAMRQAVEIALSIRRFRWQIYSPRVGHELEGLGGDDGAVRAAVQARVREALAADDRITGVEDFRFDRDGDAVRVACTVKTVFGDLKTEVEL